MILLILCLIHFDLENPRYLSLFQNFIFIAPSVKRWSIKAGNKKTAGFSERMGKNQKSKDRNNRLESAWSLHAYFKKQTDKDILIWQTWESGNFQAEDSNKDGMISVFDFIKHDPGLSWGTFSYCCINCILVHYDERRKGVAEPKNKCLAMLSHFLFL